jgi:nucleoside-diphosphate-sugar epimerase
MATVFVVGAGYVGALAAELLAAGGHTVHVGRRTPTDAPNCHALDVLRPETFPAALREAHSVVYCVAADGFSEESYRAAYVTGLRHVLEAAQGAQRVVFVSSTGVYGQDDGSVVDESSPTEPRSFSGRLLLEGEALVAQARCEATTVRFSGIYGPGRDRLVRLVRSGGPVSRSTREALTNRIHRDDCARVLVHLVERPSVAPVYVGSDEAPTPTGEILDWLAARLGLPPPPVGSDAGDSPQRGGNKRLSSARLRAEGFQFRYPTWREGFAALLEQAAK